MKQHIFGFALFNFIVISFGLIFAFLYAPQIPKVEEVKQPLVEADYRSSCWKRNQKPQARRYTSEIVSSSYFFEENKIVSKVRVSLGDGMNLPEKIFVSTSYALTSNMAKEEFGDVETFENPFTSGREREFTIVTRVTGKAKINPKDNLYVFVNVSDSNGVYNNAVLTQAKEVLLVHDKTR